MATVKAIIDEFCQRINQPVESSYVGSTKPAALQYLSLLRFVASELLKKPGEWPCLKRGYVFTTQNGVALYQLPGDFYKSLSQTQYGVTNQLIMRGPLTDARLAFETFGISSSGIFPGYQLNGPQGYVYNTSPYTQVSAGYFQITPPGANNTDQYRIGYLSRNYFWPTFWLPTHAYVSGNIVTGVANMYICTTSGTSSTVRPSVTTGSFTDGTAVWQVYTEPYPITADTDYCIFDDDLMFEGLRWAWYQASRQPYEDLRSDWEGSIKTAMGRNSAGAVISAAYIDEGWFPNVPYANWSGTGGS